MGEIDRIPQISQINQALSSVQRTGDGQRKQQQEAEEKPAKHDEVELTNEAAEVVPEVVEEEKPEKSPETGLDLAV